MGGGGVGNPQLARPTARSGGLGAHAIVCPPPAAGINRDPPANSGRDLWPGGCTILEPLRLCTEDLSIKSTRRGDMTKKHQC